MTGIVAVPAQEEHGIEVIEFVTEPAVGAVMAMMAL